MRARYAILCGVAAAALVGGTMTAVQSFAQSDMNGPQYSSPAERAQTQQLNEENVNGNDESPAALNGAGEDQDTAQAQNAPYGPQGQYNDQMQQYQAQQQQYQDQRSQYENQQRNYDRNLRYYDQAQWSYEYPQAYAYHYNDDAQLVRLDLLAEPSQQLAQVPVEGPNGVWVGRVRNVETGTGGGLYRIEISLNRRVSVWVDPRDLRFDPDEHVAYTDLTRDELWDMPGATVESGRM
jgi:hypothetical protein